MCVFIIVKYDIKSKYPKEIYRPLISSRKQKNFSEEILFRVESSASSFLV